MRILMSLLLMISVLSFHSCSMLDPDEKEINAMAVKAYKEFKSQAKVSTNKDLNAMLDRVARRVAAASKKNYEWEWLLVESPEVNAWCMPGGKIAVYTGLLPVVKTEAALAAVLGHEVAHATENHGKERYARAIKGNLTGLVIGAASAVGGQLLCKSEACRNLTGLGGAAAGFAITFFDLKFSRQEELEADKVGQKFMASAGYVPTEAVKVWERMSENSKGAAPPEILSTHPSDQTRRAKLKQWLPDAMEIYSENKAQYGIGEVIMAQEER